MTFMKSLAAIILALAACAPSAPQSISLDPMLSAVQVAAIQDGIAQWCAADGWCPTYSFDGELHVQLHTGEDWDTLPEYGEFHRRAGSGAFTSGGVIHVNGPVVEARPEMFWTTLEHEFGHAHGVKHHGEDGCTMFWRQSVESYDLTCE